MRLACIVLPTYNGEKFLTEQIESIFSQEVPPDWNLLLITADDGSMDGTPALVQEIASKHPSDVEVISFSEKGLGPRRIFEKLGAYSQKLKPDLLFFADQDDFWLPGKVLRVIELTSNVNHSCLYLGSAITTDFKLNPLGIIPRQNLKPVFPSILLSNQRAGMTMALNAKAQQDWLTSLPSEAAMHDWWIQQVLILKGSSVIVDRESFVLYRQHGGNVLGIPEGLNDKLRFLKNQGSKLFVLRSIQAVELLKYAKDDEVLKATKAVSTLVDRNFRSLISLIKILISKDFFENRIGMEKVIARFTLIYSYLTYWQRGNLQK
jgi:glycosyltransferase involved in cell wall biosynthesis